MIQRKSVSKQQPLFQIPEKPKSQSRAAAEKAAEGKGLITFNQAAGSLLRHKWIFAKTMPQCPHWYTLRKHWTGDIDFEDVVQYIRIHGYKEKFGKYWYTRLDINDMKYWSMGAPLPITILINRAYIDTPHPYDQIAPIYDEMWRDESALDENLEIIGRLNYQGGSVLDIGCGTGLFLDYVPEPDSYLGIDPSEMMLQRLLHKHPNAGMAKTSFESFFNEAPPKAKAIRTPLENFFTEERFDLVVSLFGSVSYVSPEAVTRIAGLLKPGGRFFVMPYSGPDYRPLTHIRARVDVPYHCHSPSAFENDERLTGLTSEAWHNFLIIEGKAKAEA